MKVICRKTAIEFTCSGFPTLEVTKGEHPLFSAPFSTLLSVYQSWRARELSEGESRVLFVSLLNSTDKMRWGAVPATPSVETVEANMDYLLKTANWKNAIGERLALPCYAITSTNNSLKDIEVFLEVWNTKKNEEVRAAHFQAVRDDIDASSSRLSKLLATKGSEAESSQVFLKNLFKWMVIATSVPKGIVSYWEELFLMERPKIWEPSLATDLDELKEWAEDTLKKEVASSRREIASFSALCYRRILAQHKDNKDGVFGALGYSSLSSSYAATPSTSRSYAATNFSILSNSNSSEASTSYHSFSSNFTDTSLPLVTEEEILSLTASLPPEPSLSCFTNQVDYLKERAKWKLAHIILEEKKEQFMQIRAALAAVVGSTTVIDKERENQSEYQPNSAENSAESSSKEEAISS